MNVRINKYTAGFLGISYDEAAELRKEKVRIFGTTMKWLTDCHNFNDIDGYNASIHPENVENFLVQSSELVKMMENMPQKASVLTNAPALHADRVLSFLGIKNFFENIFDLGFEGTPGKPHRETYLKALEICGADISRTLFVDDIPDYVQAFMELGGYGLLIDEDNRHLDKNLPRANSILELPDFLMNPDKIKIKG